ncbi:MAG: hypothetical protein ACI8T1_004246 [Verrucomicrobiales bacterium]|jgi:hypothetical protein
MEPTGSVRLGYGTLAEKESSCAFPVMGNQWSSNDDITSRNRRVTDPYDRWCGGEEVQSLLLPDSHWYCSIVPFTVDAAHRLCIEQTSSLLL